MLKLIIDLFWTFLKIGGFTFGGGYAMLPLMQAEIIDAKHWQTLEEFTDIIAISQMTPGPIAINSATFVGFKVSGFFGSAAATIGVIFVSVVLSNIIAKYFFKFKDTKILKNLFKGIRPAVIVLIAWSVVTVGKVSLIDIKSVIIFLVLIAALLKYKLNPILGIAASGILGALLYK